MTTTIKVTTHDWPVQVKQINLDSDGKEVSGTTEVVDPHGSREFHVTAHRELHIKELPIPVPEEKPQPETA